MAVSMATVLCYPASTSHRCSRADSYRPCVRLYSSYLASLLARFAAPVLMAEALLIAAISAGVSFGLFGGYKTLLIIGRPRNLQ